jgi:hypothetical protein
MVSTFKFKSSLNDYVIFTLAVQKERDRLGRQRSHNYGYRMVNVKSNLHYKGEPDEGGDDNDDLNVMALVRAEQTAQEVRETSINNLKDLFENFSFSI